MLSKELSSEDILDMIRESEAEKARESPREFSEEEVIRLTPDLCHLPDLSCSYSNKDAMALMNRLHLHWKALLQTRFDLENSRRECKELRGTLEIVGKQSLQFQDDLETSRTRILELEEVNSILAHKLTDMVKTVEEEKDNVIWEQEHEILKLNTSLRKIRDWGGE